MDEVMSEPTGPEEEKFVSSYRTSGYKPKEPGEDYVTDREKARSMAEAEKPFRDEKTDLKKKIPSTPMKPKEPSAFSRFTGIGMRKYEQAVAGREQAIQEQGKVVEEIIEKDHELDAKAKEAAENAEKDYVRTEAKYYALPSQPSAIKEAKLPERTGEKSYRLPLEDEK